MNISMILAIVGGILVTVFGLIAALKDKETPKRIYYGVCFAGILVLISGILGDVASSNKTKELLNKDKKIIALLEENQKLNNKLSGSITGGDSYCYFLPSRPSKNSSILDLLLTHKGIHPLYDVTVKIVDVEKMTERGKKMFAKEKLPYDSLFRSMITLTQDSQIFQVGNLAPNTAKQLTIPFPVDISKKSYNVSIMARNGSLIQFIRFRRIDKYWKLATKVNFKGKVVEEHIDKDFPRNEAGQIDW